MNRMAFSLALLLGAAAPALAGPAEEAARRDANNWDVILQQYPPRARAAGEQGPVGFKVTLDREGYASACEITRSSGYRGLDDETCQLILNRATFKGVRDANGRKVNSVHEGVLNWRLPNVPPSATPPVRTASAKTDAPEKLICKRKARTGTLAGFERTCLTKNDWQRLSERSRDEWREMSGRGSITSN